MIPGSYVYIYICKCMFVCTYIYVHIYVWFICIYVKEEHKDLKIQNESIIYIYTHCPPYIQTTLAHKDRKLEKNLITVMYRKMQSWKHILMAQSTNIYSAVRHLAQLKICSAPCPQKRLRYKKEEKQNKSMINASACG